MYLYFMQTELTGCQLASIMISKYKFTSGDGVRDMPGGFDV